MPRCAGVDVAVIGGGPAGSAVAISLVKAHHRVVLLDYAAKPGLHWGESLPPAANPILSELGVSQEAMAADHLRSCGTQSAWGENILQDSLFIRHPRGPGWCLDRATFDAKLRSIASQIGAHVLTYSGQLRVHREHHGCWRLVINTPEESAIQARWIVDCSGRRGWLASRLGIKRIHLDRQVAIGGIFTNPGKPADYDTATLVEAVSSGWWYTIRVPSGERTVVYLTHPGGTIMRHACTRAGFLDLLSDTVHLRRRLEKCGCTLTHGPTVALGNSSRLEVLGGDGWIAAGDAAMAFDPLSSQGVFNALYSGVRAARAVSASLSGDSLALESYVQSLDAVYAEYVIKRKLVYSLERRWSNNHFWQSALSTKPNPAIVNPAL